MANESRRRAAARRGGRQPAREARVDRRGKVGHWKGEPEDAYRSGGVQSAHAAGGKGLGGRLRPVHPKRIHACCPGSCRRTAGQAGGSGRVREGSGCSGIEILRMDWPPFYGAEDGLYFIAPIKRGTS